MDDDDDYKELHSAIENANMELVRQLLPDDCEGHCFLHGETSALYKAFCRKHYEIASYLIHKGAHFHAYDGDVYDLDNDLSRVNCLLWNYNRKSEKSCVFRFLTLSHSPQGLNGDRLKAVMAMYEYFFEASVTRLLMRVLESEQFDIVYCFKSEQVNRMYRLRGKEAEIYGLTLSNSREIFVGAKNLLSGDVRKIKSVYGVVAEEICHLAMTVMFENDAKPYKVGDKGLNQEFGGLIRAVMSATERSCHTESVIQNVFEYYDFYEWECELIARVPHVVGIYGEELGKRVFQESPELSRLLDFYEENVQKKCELYTDPELNTKSHRVLEGLSKWDEFISYEEKQTEPLKEGFKSFRDFVVVRKGISVIATNCTKLCVLHVYHELKKEFKDQLEKKCLFFSNKCFRKESKKIVDALKGDVFQYLVLVLDEKELSERGLQCEYTDHFHQLEAGRPEVVIISNSQHLGSEFQNKAVCYGWNDLRDEFQALRQHINYLFKGEEKDIYVRKEDFPKIFDKEEIMRIISGEVLKVEDGAENKSRGYIPETYIDRNFQIMTVDEKYLQKLPTDTCVFISGLSREDLKELSIDGRLVHWLSRNSEIEGGKSIFASDKKAVTFEGFLAKLSESATERRTNIHLHHKKKLFYLRDSSWSVIPKEHRKQMTITEEEMVHLLESERFTIISDNAGSGKSTTVSSLIRHIERKDGSWIWRCNLNKFCRNQRDPLSLSHINENDEVEEVLDHLFLMLGFKNGLEKLLFKTPNERGKCYLLFDAYDEVPSKFRSKFLKLLSTLKVVRGVNLIVTTRRVLQLELEQLLSTGAHQLAPFTTEAQVGYLVKLWGNKLKFPNGQPSFRDQKAVPGKITKIINELKNENLGPEYEGLLALEKVRLDNGLDSLRSEIDELNFSKLAERVLDKGLLGYGTLKFMGIPLHLYMIGTICYEDNFKPAHYSDIFDLYSQFVERKILEYLEERLGLAESSFKDEKLEETREEAERIHIGLAGQLIDQENECLASEMNTKDRELISDLGIAFIEGESIQFIHQTFAEFFIAKSLEKNMQEGVFKKVLLEDKYDTVVAFLSCGLRKKNFGNFTEDFFNVDSFLVEFMKRIVHKRPFFSRYVPNADVLCRFRILKTLLEILEEKFELRELKEELERMLSNPKCYDTEELDYHCIGGCLTVNLLMYLLERDLKVNSIILLSFLRYAENGREVTEALEEFISLESGLCDTENGGNDTGNAERLSELRTLKDSSGDGLLYHALCNDKAEIFAHLLKFFKDNLSGKKFTEEIVQSCDYKRQVGGFINSVHFRRTWMLLEELHSAFGNEVAVLFDDDSKRKIICNAVKTDVSDGLTSFSEKVTSLFKDCFGSQEWKPLARSVCIDSTDLINVLRSCSSRNLMKYLDILKNIFNEDGEMKQVLMCKIGGSCSFLHLGAFKKDMCFDVLLRFFAGFLEEEAIKEMLLCPDKYDHNVMHYFFTSDFYHSEKTIRNLSVIMEKYGKDERFKGLPKSMDKDFNNIFKLSVLKGNNLEYLLKFCGDHFEKDDIKKIISSAHDNNFMQCLFWEDAPKTIVNNLNQIKEFFDDDESFKELLKQTWPSRNIFQLAGSRDMYLEDLLEFCHRNLELREIEEMICSPDKEGHNLIHYFFTRNSPETLMNNLILIWRVLGDDRRFRQLLSSERSLFKNLYRLAGLKNSYLDNLLVNE